MSSTLTAVSSVDRTQHVCPCVIFQSASPLNCVLQLQCTFSIGNTAGEGQHRLIRSALSRPADVAVAQNDLPPSCATGPGPVAHPASCSMTSPSDDQSDLLLMRPPPETGVRWAKQARHASQMDRLHLRGEEVAVAAPARPSGRDGVMASPPPPRRRWLLERRSRCTPCLGKSEYKHSEKICLGRPFEPSFCPSSWPAPLQHDPVSPARRLTCGPVA